MSVSLYASSKIHKPWQGSECCPLTTRGLTLSSLMRLMQTHSLRMPGKVSHCEGRPRAGRRWPGPMRPGVQPRTSAPLSEPWASLSGPRGLSTCGKWKWHWCCLSALLRTRGKAHGHSVTPCDGPSSTQGPFGAVAKAHSIWDRIFTPVFYGA